MTEVDNFFYIATHYFNVPNDLATLKLFCALCFTAYVGYMAYKSGDKSAIGACFVCISFFTALQFIPVFVWGLISVALAFIIAKKFFGGS